MQIYEKKGGPKTANSDSANNFMRSRAQDHLKFLESHPAYPQMTANRSNIVIIHSNARYLYIIFLEVLSGRVHELSKNLQKVSKNWARTPGAGGSARSPASWVRSIFQTPSTTFHAKGVNPDWLTSSRLCP